MTVFDNLKAEHRAIVKVLDVIEKLADRIEKGDLSDIDTVQQAVDFFKNFADRCHHGKEEELLFPLLVEKGLPAKGGPISHMLTEHVEGRDYIREISEGLSQVRNGATDTMSLVNSLRGYAAMLKAHIHKEDNGLFISAGRLLTAKEQADLYEKFGLLENNDIGKEVIERYYQLAGELEQRFGMK